MWGEVNSDRFEYENKPPVGTTKVYLPYISSFPANLDQRSQSLAIMMTTEGVFEQASERQIQFDADQARSLNIPEEHIVLASEITNFTNDILSYYYDDDGTGEPIDLYDYADIYPHMMDYFIYIQDNPAPSQELQRPPVVGMLNCGAWWDPRPNGAVGYVAVPSADPEADLLALGFHKTPQIAGGGFTRPQTFRWWACGFGTYRDHAYTFPTKYEIQDYAGINPRGEPNPEVWRTGPWPYEVWPAYVAWWHATF